MKETVFTHPSQLNRLKPDPLRRTIGLGRLTLGGNLSGHPQKDAWEKELNRRYYACGCTEGALGLITGLLGGGIWQGIRYFKNPESFGYIVLWILGIAIAGAVLGKVYGLARAAAPLKQIIRDIQKNWKVEPTAERTIYHCG